MNIIFYTLCCFVILNYGSTLEEQKIVKLAMTKMFVGFESLDAENGTKFKDQLLTQILNSSDDNLHESFNSVLMVFYNKGSPKLKNVVLIFKETVDKIKPVDLRIILQDLQELNLGNETRPKRQYDYDDKVFPIGGYTLKDIPRIIYPDELTTSTPRTAASDAKTYAFQAVTDDDDKVFITPENIMNVILQHNHSEDDINRIHKIFHSNESDSAIEKVKAEHTSNEKLNPLVEIFIQKNHSEEIIENMHRMFHLKHEEKMAAVNSTEDEFVKAKRLKEIKQLESNIASGFCTAGFRHGIKHIHHKEVEEDVVVQNITEISGNQTTDYLEN